MLSPLRLQECPPLTSCTEYTPCLVLQVITVDQEKYAGLTLKPGDAVVAVAGFFTLGESFENAPG